MRFLIIDNNQDDRERIKQEFQKEFYGLEFLEVIKREDFDEAIVRGDFDVALTDHLLNWTDGLWVLRTIKERLPDIPVVMVTDTGSEEIAVEGMKSGLSDYILKRHLNRLPAAVKEILEKVRFRREYGETNRQLTAREEDSYTHPKHIPDFAYDFRVEPDGTLMCECVTEAFTYITGYTPNELDERGGFTSIVHPADMSVFAQHRESLFSGRPNICEFRIITRSGEIRWLCDHAQPVRSETFGRVIHIYGTAQVITERKQYEDTLRDSEAKYYKLLETSNDAIFIADAASGIILDTNKKAEDLLGYPREEIIGMHHTQLHPAEEATHYMNIFEGHARTGKAFSKGLYVRHKNGHKIPVEINTSVAFLGDRKIVQGVFRDLTERKQAEESIRLYAEILNNIHIGLIAWHLENIDDVKTYRLIAANTAAVQFIGSAAGELTGKTMTESFPSLIGTEVPKIYAEVARSGKVKELREDHFIDKSAFKNVFSVKAFPLSNNSVGVAFVDITESEKIHEELKIFKMLFSEIRDLAYICDTQGNILYVNKIFERFTGHKPEEFAGKPFSPLFDEENLKKAMDAHARSAKGESLQFELCFKDTGIVCEYRNFHLRDAKGTIVRTIGVARDVTERKRTEKALIESHERLTSILDSLNAVVYVADMETFEILYANKYLRDIMGDVTGKICWQTFQANQVNQCNFCTNDKLLDANGNPTGIYSWEFQNTVNGRWYTISDRAIKWIDGRIVRLEIATDITMRKYTEEALRDTNQTLQALIQASPLAIIALDPQGNVTRWNLAAEHMFGWNQQEVIGHHLPIVPDDKQEEFRALRERVLRGESFTGIEVRRRKRDGSPIDISISTAPLRNGQGNINGIMGVVADVTERKQTQAINDLLHEIDQFVLQGLTQDFILPYVCTRLVDIFAYPLTWIGMKEADGTVSISAKAGTHTDYLADLRVRWDDTPDGQCTMGLAVRGKKTQTSSDTQEPAIRQCQERASRYGFQSFAAVPLFVHDKILGALNLYAFRPHVFDTETIRMLENLAAHISVTLLIAMDQQQLRLQGIAMASVANAVFITDCGGHIKWVNNAFTRLSGYTAEEVYGKTPRLFKSGKHDNPFYRQVWQTLLAGEVWRGEVVNRRKDGGLYTVSQTITPLLDTHGKVCHFVAIHEDITAKKEVEERIVYMANYDTLTNLPNRTMFLDHLELELAHAHRNKQMVAVMFLDLDRFKIINDTLGHTFGDQLLKAAAERLRGCVREGDTVSRLGGDEFTFIISDITNPQDVVLIAQKILNVMSRSFLVEGYEVHVTPSIGIALYPTDATDADSLIKKADTAMYHAKEQGRNTFKFYMEDMNIHTLERLKLENDLRKALEKGELLVYYQPLIDQNTGQIISMEALVRWQHPELGMIYPAKFIPIAEETGLIIPIGEWVLTTACTQTRIWHDAGFSTLRITVNLSARQFKQQQLVNTIKHVLQKTGLDPHYLELELTEGIIMQNNMAILATLYELKALGILFSIDDFGTEYSSLSYLKRFPIDTLKIDRSFVRDITTNPDDAAIVTAIIAIAESLKLKVVAEGVENKEQAAFLHQLHCNNIQGYVYSHPLPAVDIEHLLQKGHNTEYQKQIISQ